MPFLFPCTNLLLTAEAGSLLGVELSVMRKAVRYTLIVLILCCYPVFVDAQVSLQDLVNDYVEAIIKKQDATSCLSRLNMYYKQKKPTEQAEILKTIYDTITKMQEDGKNKETLALIDLYQFFADPIDKNLPLLYYIKGDISITELNDSVSLKNCIKDLQMCDNKKFPQVEEYIQTLQGLLVDFRNYVPVMKRLDGLWVGINIESGNHPFPLPNGYNIGTPCYVIQVEGSSLRMYGYYGSSMVKAGDKLFSKDDESNTMSQHIVELRNNRIYADWSSEKLSEPNPVMLSTMMSLSGSVGDLLANNLFGDISNTLTDLGSSIFSSALSSLVSSAFAPSKEITIVQGELELINDYEMVGIFNSQIITIKSDKSPEICKTTEKILFTRWDVDENNFFIDIGRQCFYPNDYPNWKNEKKIKKLDSYKKNHKLIISVREKLPFIPTNIMETSNNYFKAWAAFNSFQITKQLYRNELKMKKQGLALSPTYNSDRNHTTLGCSYDNLSLHVETEKMEKGLYIEDVEDYSTAYLHGIKQGDVLLKIDGFEMNTPKQAVSYIESLEPFTTVNLEILRKGKVLKIPVELSYKIVTH